MKKIAIFIMLGFFVPVISFAATVSVLVVAGGGGGGAASGGGGGAGGFQYNASFSLAAGPISVTVGGGGGGGVPGGANGSNGSDSIFSTITATGGGGGGTGGVNGLNGGSGGGGSYGATSGGTGSQGNNGGGGGGFPFPSGGGGGASAVGENSSGSQSGDGGAGISNSITGSAVIYAGGGGGTANSSGAIAGSGGDGGGADGGSSTAYNGTANTGGGGGGTDSVTAGSGGSGIVIIAYPIDGSTGISTSTGGTITTDGTNWIHTFTSNGTFTPTIIPTSPNITGGGTINRLAKFTASTTIGDSLLSDDGSNTTLTAGNFFMPIGSLFDSVASGALNFGTTNATTMTFGRSDQNMVINSNVGIGTSTPASTLTVIGDIFANFINIAANGLGLDTLTSGTLSIGSTTASAIKIGRASTTTTFPGTISFAKASSISNCSSTTTPSTCGSAPAGSVALPTGGSTLVVDTSAVSANSQIFVTEDSSLGTRLDITCNTTTGRVYSISARTVSTSFTIKSSSNPATNKACLSYWIVN